MTGAAPRIDVRRIEIFERGVKMRLPFRYGNVTLSEGTQAFVRIEVAIEDESGGWLAAKGVSAELLAPKWFDKSPGLSNDDTVDQLRQSLSLAASAYGEALPKTAFGHFSERYDAQIREGRAAGMPPLAAGFGPALLDKAILDGLSKAVERSPADVLRSNLIGVTPDLTADLDAEDVRGTLAEIRPGGSIAARHTVGLLDPLVDGDRDEPVKDGLPETLEEVIAAYGQTHFKLKVGGNAADDAARLARIAGVLDQLDGPYAVTIDGNEQYSDVEGLTDLLDRCEADPALSRLMGSLLFIEQPLDRGATLTSDLSAIATRYPLMIDESDGEVGVFSSAQKLGYSGVSSKSCKGYFKSILNLARCRKSAREVPGPKLFLSGEDLSCQAGLAVQQSLGLVDMLGIRHVERNGHHYVFGLRGHPETEQQAFREAYPGLYQCVAGTTCLQIHGGQVDTSGLVDQPGFASTAEPAWGEMRRVRVVEGG